MEQYVELFWTAVQGVSMVVAGCTILAKLTKTKTDDELIAKVHKYIEAIAELKKPTK